MPNCDAADFWCYNIAACVRWILFLSHDRKHRSDFLRFREGWFHFDSLVLIRNRRLSVSWNKSSDLILLPPVSSQRSSLLTLDVVHRHVDSKSLTTWFELKSDSKLTCQMECFLNLFDLFVSNWGKAHRRGLERGSPSKKKRLNDDWMNSLARWKQANQISSLPVDPGSR